MLRKVLGPLLVLVVLGGAAGVAYASHGHDDGGSKRVQQVTSRFHSLAVADKAGYKLLLDNQGIACIDMPGMGAMGVAG